MDQINKKRYSVSLPASLYEELARIADEQDMNVVELLRRFIRLGLYVTKLEQSPNENLCVLRDGEVIEKIVVL